MGLMFGKGTQGSLIGIGVVDQTAWNGAISATNLQTALRREGINVSFWRFLKLGLMVMTPALLIALAAPLVANASW